MGILATFLYIYFRKEGEKCQMPEKLDFLDFEVIVQESKHGKNKVIIKPDFTLNYNTRDLMIHRRDFYAVWVAEKGLWSKNESDVIDIIDKLAMEKASEYSRDEYTVIVEYMKLARYQSIDRWHKFCQKQMREIWHELDERVTFANTETTRESYASKRLPYSIVGAETPAYTELMEVLYDADERRKLEWAVGAIISGESRRLQKFIVLYGSAGSGKSTFLNIVQLLFEGYLTNFNAKELGSSRNDFALEAFKSDPLVAIQHDGDLSRIEDNTKLNSLVSHEPMEINEKYQPKRTACFHSFLFMGTNRPVKITEAKSGILRRLIDVIPSGRKLPIKKYERLMKQVEFELGGIAQHCLDIFQELGPDYYNDYVPISMMSATNHFYEFVDENYYDWAEADIVTLNEAWKRYDEYCKAAKINFPFNRTQFRVELGNYFKKYDERTVVDGIRTRNVYSGFKKEKFPYLNETPVAASSDGERSESWLIFQDRLPSLLDVELKNSQAQYATKSGVPSKPWSEVTTTLTDIDTSKLHYVLGPDNLIVIDFDIPGDDGKKSFERNWEAASMFPPTYAELSKSGAGIHLHYFYAGDVTRLAAKYADNVEIKVFTGKASLRRKLTACNDIPIATISSNLPMKEEKKKVVNWEGFKDEQHLRNAIVKALKKEIENASSTHQSVQFIYDALEQAYESGMSYDLLQMRGDILKFASKSTHQSVACLKLVSKMKFRSKDREIAATEDYVTDVESDWFQKAVGRASERKKIFFDCEVFQNLFLINWKFPGDCPCVRMINPGPSEVENLMQYDLIGFNNRKYDNHILWGRMMGYSNMQLYNLSKGIIAGNRDMMFGNAYSISYADIYDICSKKQSLKKWEIELRAKWEAEHPGEVCPLRHKELALDWDQPVPEELWETVAEYCDNDVIATEWVWNDRQEDVVAREILASLSGLTINDTTRMHTTKIIFGDEKHPQLEYTDLRTTFPGYEFVRGEDFKMHNMYRGVDMSFGGYVYAEPGMYWNVALLDVESLHPHSIIAMNVFGEYTKRFKDILDARLAIKHNDVEKVKTLLDGALVPYLGSEEQMAQLSQALKIVINSVYGYTSATFDNPFKDPRNVNNIVALRGALFMKTLQDKVVEKGFKVVHVKTDSIKIPGATPELIQFCMEFAHAYGYNFEHEATYEKMCLVNDAVYIAKYKTAEECEAQYGYLPSKNRKKSGKWTATGTQFQVPYVFKTLFSHEELIFDDYCETKSVTKGALYLDLNEELPEGEHNYKFVGRVGNFCPVVDGCGGGYLYRKDENGKYNAAAGTKGYKWLESETVLTNGLEDKIDISYYEKLAEEAVKAINNYGNFNMFAGDTPEFMNIPEGASEEGLPWD